MFIKNSESIKNNLDMDPSGRSEGPMMVVMDKSSLGMGIDKKFYMGKNVGWILFTTHNFYYLLRYTIAFSKCEFENYI